MFFTKKAGMLNIPAHLSKIVLRLEPFELHQHPGETAVRVRLVLHPTPQNELLQSSAVIASATVRDDGAYFIPDLVAGEYLWQVVDGQAQVLGSRAIAVLADQPTTRLEDTVEACRVQSTYSIEPATQTRYESDGAATFTISRTPATVAETVYLSTVQNQGFNNQGDYVGKLDEPSPATEFGKPVDTRVERDPGWAHPGQILQGRFSSFAARVSGRAFPAGRGCGQQDAGQSDTTDETPANYHRITLPSTRDC